ncbi:sporulation-delaying protein SdpB family protein [Priestia megaterium]|uniref:sporulation-delaying protein SdpB family protein n=1 Tax=Priestia megaterium TaxID=1404 RepID=UPI0028772DE4|nr:sporulation-delaying protein SdpB family protein [Priestia megaterium]MBX4163798.1 hypothetical protein [Priestia megaterium]
MFKKKIEELNHTIVEWAISHTPWTNVYGVARSIMALATALTLIFNDASIFFRPGSGGSSPFCTNYTFSIFCITPHNLFYLNIVRFVCIFLLLLVVSGWRPRFTGIIHWWICYSLQASALTIDGGEQASTVFTFLLIPITLLDSRKWHWQEVTTQESLLSKKQLYFRIFALITFVIIRIQIAILYFNSVVAKLFDEDWVNGTAVYYYAQNSMLGFPDILKKIFDFVLTSNLVVIPTWGTLIVQTIIFSALIAPKKLWKPILFIAVFMHEIFAIMLGLISFSMIMGSILILYLRPLEETFKFPSKIFNNTKSLFGRRNANKGNTKKVAS